MTDWNPALYDQFADERSRPARDLAAAIPGMEARLMVDLGCGSGSSTAMLAARWPQARLIGVDTSPAMLAAAQDKLPQAEFLLGDAASWQIESPVDVIFANAVFHWVPDHPALMRHLAAQLGARGVIAFQMPDNLDEPSHALMAEIAQAPEFGDLAARAAASRTPLLSMGAYVDLLSGLGLRVDLWRTTYVHALANADAVVEMVRSTGLKPYLDLLPDHMRATYLSAYRAAIARAYPPQANGQVLFRFPRLFVIAQKTTDKV